MDDLSALRLAAVREHMALEIVHDWDGVIATFAHPRGELLGPGVVCEFWLTGTHSGPLQVGKTDHPPTGKSFRIRWPPTSNSRPAATKSSPNGRSTTAARYCGHWT